MATEDLQTLEKFDSVKFNYKDNKTGAYLGFIDEDVPDLVAMLTKVVQEQQKDILDIKKRNREA